MYFITCSISGEAIVSQQQQQQHQKKITTIEKVEKETKV